jgi:hypothetical protein
MGFRDSRGLRKKEDISLNPNPVTPKSVNP